MALSNALTLLLSCLVLCTPTLEQRHLPGKRSKRDQMASMSSFFTSIDKRLAALETRWDNNTEGRLAARLEAKIEGEMQRKLQDVKDKQQDVEQKLQDVEEKLQDVEEELQYVDEKLQGVQSGMQRMESMITEILSSRRKAVEEEVEDPVDSKSSVDEESLSAKRTSKIEAQSSSVDLNQVAKLEAELSRLKEKVSDMGECLQNNNLSAGNNDTMQPMEGVVQSVTQLLTVVEQSLKFTTENVTKFLYQSTASLVNDTTLASIVNDAKSQMALLENNTALLNASIAKMEQSTRNMAARVSAVEDSLDYSISLQSDNSTSLQSDISTSLPADNSTSLPADNSTSLPVNETENSRATCKDVRKWIEDLKNKTPEVVPQLMYRRSCQDYYDHGLRTSGVYTLLVEAGRSPMEVYCDMSNGSGWVVFQRRQDGSEDFHRNWQTYEDGFGDIYGEFWLGNKNIHRLTSAGLTQLRVDLQAWDGSTAFASYYHFSVGDANSSYRLSVTGYSGTAGDSMEYHNGHKFTTHDQDNDARSSGNCAQLRKGAWWYVNCATSNLNGQYGSMDSTGWQYAMWNHWLGTHSLLRTELKLKARF